MLLKQNKTKQNQFGIALKLRITLEDADIHLNFKIIILKCLNVREVLLTQPPR